jgi:hypothetical protein
LHWVVNLVEASRSEAAADQLCVWAQGEADKIIGERWADVEYLVNVLRRFDDEMAEEELQAILRHFPRAESRARLMHRKDGFVSGAYRTRRGLSRPSGLDPVTREIDAVLSTGAAVRRRDWDGEYLEVLDMSPNAVRLARLNQGASVLDSHNWSGVGAMLGDVVPGSARLEDGALVARIKFSRGSELAQRVVRDLEDGIQIPLSVGYKVHKTVESRRTDPVTRTATDWEPIEVSLVPIAAEETGTGFRTAA